MSKDYICGGTTYTFDKNIIALPTKIPQLPQSIEVKGVTLFLKSRFHVSLVCAGMLVEKHSIKIDDFYNKLVNRFCLHTSKLNQPQIKYNNQFHFVQQHERKSLIISCDIAGIKEFFDRINEEFNLQLEHPPLHLTLYTLQPNKGMFLIDQKAFEDLAKPINNARINEIYKLLTV